MNPRHPVYIVSKGRWERRITMRFLDEYRVPFRVVVEEQEVGHYAEALGRDRLLILDPAYQSKYETCDDLGDSKSKGPGPARNFAWDHAISEGHDHHWVMDDNILGFFRLNHNMKIPVGDGTIFHAMESFVDRYDNIAMAGPNYFMFASRKHAAPPMTLNTRIYSCNLIRNDVPFRWRGRYNEDTDLSLRMLKAGWATVQFNAFLQKKLTTQTVQGGNTEAFYSREGTLPKSRMIARLHPDCVVVRHRFGRWHHLADYSGFTHKLHRREGVEIPAGTDDFGMVLRQLEGVRTKARPAGEVRAP